MRQRDILRMWATIVQHTGKDKYSNEEWQESFEFFCRCMQSPTPPYIENIDQLVKMEMDEMAKPKQPTRNVKKDSQDVKLTDDSNNSSDIGDDLQPLSVLKKRLKLQTESKATSNILNCKQTNKSENNLREQKPSKSSTLTAEISTKCRRTGGQVEKIVQSEGQLEMANTEKEEELDNLQAQIEKQKIKKNVKGDSIKAERLIEQSNPIKGQDQKQEKSRRQLKEKTDSKVLKSEKPIKANDLRIQDQKQEQQNVKKGTKEKQALNQERNLNDNSKIAKLNTRARSKRQSKSKPINGILNAHMPLTPINLTYEATTTTSEEPLQSTEIAENLIVQNQVSSRSDRNSISSDISEIVVDDNLTSIPTNESLLINLQIDGYQDISQLLVEDNADLIIDAKENSDGDVIAKDEIERYLQCYSAKTPSEMDHEMADTSSFFDNIPNLTEGADILQTSSEIIHKIADCSNLFDDISNLTTESIEMLQTSSKINHDIADAPNSFNNILTTDTEETTEMLKKQSEIDQEMADASNFFNNISNLATESIDHEIADASHSFNNILNETTDSAETTEKEAIREMLETPSADTSNFFDNIPDLTPEMPRTPLENDSILQDVPNYDYDEDDDDDDALSVATSWNGEELFKDDTEKTHEPDSFTKDVQNIRDRSEKDEIIEKVKPNQQLNDDFSEYRKKTENEEPNGQMEVQISTAKNKLEELRSFRIPKKTETNEIPAKQINEQQVTRESNPQKQLQLNGYQKKQKVTFRLEQRPLNGYQKPNGQIQAKQAPQTVQRNHHSHEQQVARSNCNESMTTSARVPIFAPPYRLPVKPTPSLPMILSANDHDNGMSEIFGIKCWHNFMGRCFKTNCIHRLADIGDIKRRLDLMNESQLIVAYQFVLRHKFLFKFCFSLFAEVFGSRAMHTKLVQMVDHCDLYMDCSVPFTTEIFYVMVRYKMTPEVAASHFMKYLWKPINAVVYPDLAIQLLRILASADWYNYTLQLEELFSHKEFQTPIEFIVSIAIDAFAKNQPQLIDKLYEVILFIPFGRNRDALTSIFTILQKAPQQQQQQEMESHEIQQQLVEVQLQLQMIQQQHMQQQSLQQQLMQQQHSQQYRLHQQHMQQQSLEQQQLQQQQHTQQHKPQRKQHTQQQKLQQQHTSKQNTQQQNMNQQHTQQQHLNQQHTQQHLQQQSIYQQHMQPVQQQHMQKQPIHQQHTQQHLQQQPIHQQLMQQQSVQQQHMQQQPVHQQHTQQHVQQQPVHQQHMQQQSVQQQHMQQQPIHQQHMQQQAIHQIVQQQQTHIQQHQLHQKQQQLQQQQHQPHQQHMQQLPRKLLNSMQRTQRLTTIPYGQIEETNISTIMRPV